MRKAMAAEGSSSLRSSPLAVCVGRLGAVRSKGFGQVIVPNWKCDCRIPAVPDEIGRLGVCRADVREVAGNPVVGSP